MGMEWWMRDALCQTILGLTEVLILIYFIFTERRDLWCIISLLLGTDNVLIQIPNLHAYLCSKMEVVVYICLEL